MKKYELMIILKPLLPEDIRAGLQKKLEKLVVKGEGKIIATDAWGKRHLAFPIKKHDEGYYIVYKLSMKQAYAQEFQRELKLTSDILRFLLTELE
jgi:small subunit ribosomal protein S6